MQIPLLETQQLTGGYGDRTIVQDIHLSLIAGEWLSLVGANGSGKSTLLRLLSRILTPTHGAVLLDGKAIHQQPPRIVAQRLSLLPQQQTIPEGLTVEQLVALGRAPHQAWWQWELNALDQQKVRTAIEQTQLQDAQASGQDNRQETGNYITLGALGTAFLAADLPRVLLIDEIDKSDIDLPNDLLNLFEDGEFPIPELQRLEMSETPVRTLDRENGKQRKVTIRDGVVRCRAFPLVIMTSNGERDFPPPFLRRCLRLRMPNPSPKELEAIVEKHLGEQAAQQSKALIEWFCEQIDAGAILATDQLLNAIHLRTQERTKATKEFKLSDLEQRLLKDLSSPEEV